MNHFDSKTWIPIVPANGTSVRHPSIVSDAGKVMTVTWQGTVADTNRLVKQLCAMPDLVAALRGMVEAPEGIDINSFGLRRLAHARARAALEKLES